jgi:predicted nucleotidyltransferase
MDDLIDGVTVERLRTVGASRRLRLLCVFGSTATGRASAESDLDLAAWFGDPPRAAAEEAGLLADVLDVLPPQAPPLDLAVLDLADPLIKFMVATDGRPIFEQPPGAFVEFSVRAAAAYRDSEKYRMWLRDYLREYARSVQASGVSAD